MNYNYIEIVTNGIQNRGEIVKLPEGKSNYDLDYYGKEVTDSFHSAFLHTEDYHIYRDLDGRKRGYNGNVFSECLFWDLDNTDLKLARNDTIELVERLCVFHKENINIYFSGNKGFHVIYICPELNLLRDTVDFNDKLKNICSYIAKGIESFDDKIYDKTRILRTVNSKHPKTNLYKIKISIDELYTLTREQLFELASKQRKSELISFNETYDEEII